tara:strand:+ start:6931 stop:7422 length:492 start_codon:yes stop_codon:yes gene_type:complete
LLKLYKKLKLIVYDFDGIMTNNKVLIDVFNNEYVQVNRSDGLAISEIKKMNIDQIIISSEKNNLVKSRAKKLNIKCFNNVDNKKIVLQKYCKKNKIDLSSVMYLGNDINDLMAMSIVGYKFCPKDSSKEIIKISDKVLKSKGGDGVIRELFDYLKNGGANNDN